MSVIMIIIKMMMIIKKKSNDNDNDKYYTQTEGATNCGAAPRPQQVQKKQRSDWGSNKLRCSTSSPTSIIKIKH